MKLKEQHRSEKRRFSREEIRTIFLFWAAWSAYALLAAFLIMTLLTNWPGFLHAAKSLGR